jgi:AmmeMemoRadiSam system protein B
MNVRRPAVAGRFYPRQRDACLQNIDQCLAAAGSAPADSGTVVGGIGPHAGWICSGAVAAQVATALSAGRHPKTAVLFGAVHVPTGRRAAIYPEGAWETPLGTVEIDSDLARAILSADNGIEANTLAHEMEHSIEVHVPFLQKLLPGLRIVPIMVPVNDHAPRVGAAVGRACREAGADVIVLGSTDLTHYGPTYDFVPRGIGVDGLAWAKEHNDRRMIELMLKMDESAIVPEARQNWNACGAGAIAATIAASKQLGATRATLLRHTTSFEVLGNLFKEEPIDAVGYAGIVFSRAPESA